MNHDKPQPNHNESRAEGANHNQSLPPQYNPKTTEDQIYQLWEKSGAFTPSVGSRSTVDGEPFVIVIPPPNVTGSLHMGHALNNTVIDILIRRSRMKGVPTLYLPGTDHAGIATQNVVEKQLQKEGPPRVDERQRVEAGKSRHDLGREEFVKRVWEWVDEYGHIIIDQLKKMGCSCDWSRQKFTMDEEYSEAVKAAFEHYYDKGLIYQGERVINWCVRCQTALSDIEVEYKEQPAKLYFFRYDKNFPIPIATTRPETKLGDTAVAVNPNDERYKKYVGQEFEANFAGKKLKNKIISDPSIDPKFGTGAVGVTPAHSLADAEIAGENKLESIKIIDQYGKMTKEAGKDYEGLKTAEAREKVTEWLKNNDLLEKEEDINNNISVCYRCGKELEPQPSKQWFLKMSELIKPAIEAIETDQIKLTPTRWKKVYLDWMKNIRDWCISRQIWWGHRLPVWELGDSGQVLGDSNKLKPETLNLKPYVGSNPPEGYIQSPDVLDTWFSSALWPFAALGWPQKNLKSQNSNLKSDLDYFYPTTVLSTARDINMLWVVRMIFSGFEFMQKKPFSQVYVHPTIFNIEGKRMSKSLGTGIDPLDLIDKYGADAMRFGLTYINTGTQDIKFDENAILAGKKFANKLWNISRFVMMQTANSNLPASNSNQAPSSKSEIDKKILQSLNHLITSYNHNLDEFKFGQAAHDLYDFIWHDLADIYIEGAKKQFENALYRVRTTEILLYVLATSLKLLHPMMPFITEEIWQQLVEQKLVEKANLITAEWPSLDK